MTSTPSPPVLPPALRRDLVALLGSQAVLTDVDRLLVYESDGLTRYRQPPLAVVLPHDTESCAGAVSMLHGAGLAVVPRGAGTGLSGGAVAAPGAVLVGTSRMNRILALDPEARRARVQAGVINTHLTAAAAPHGLAYAPDPSSQSACTLGGNVAENSGGPHCLKYGVTSRYVTALTVVGPGGRMVELRRDPAGHGPAGLDLVGVFVGSEGCFGLATELELALVPAPQAVRTLLAAFPRPDEAGAAVTAILADGLVPAALEIVDGATIRAVESSVYAAGYPIDAGAALVVEFDGPEAGLDEDLARAAQLCAAGGATEVRVATGEDERLALWAGRKKAFGAMGRLSPDLLVQDATVPRSRLPDVLRQVDAIARRWRLTVANVFHAGDGNLHPNLLFDRRDPEQVERVERASREIMEACVAAGGTITGEHGVGLDKRAYMPLVCGPGELAAMEGVRRVFDPAGLFNPGKVLPDGVPPSGSGPRSGPPRPEDPAAALAAEGVELEEGPHGGPVALPGDAGAVARVLARASAAGWRVAVTGGGRDRAGADLTVSTRRLRSMEAHEPADLTVAAGAGTPMQALQTHLAGAGQWLAVDGPGAESASLGALVAAGDARAMAAAYGAVRDQVLGLTLVTGDGRSLTLGGGVVKNVAGFDLVRLAVGSRGRLGIITRVVLRTHPRPRDQAYTVLEAPDALSLVPAVAAVLQAPLVPASMELGSGPEGAALLVRVVGAPALVAYAAGVFRDRMGAGARVLAPDEGLARQGALRAVVADGGRIWRGPPSSAALDGWLRSRAGAGGGRPLAFWALPDQGLVCTSAGAGTDGFATAARADETVEGLERGVRRVFDPAGVFARPGEAP